jgi:hypothetical protein
MDTWAFSSLMKRITGKPSRVSTICPLSCVERFESETLVISIPTGPHEALQLSIYHAICFNMIRMGLDNMWDSTKGATTFRPSPPYHSDGGEGDSTGGPEFPDPEDGDWPSLVVEAGYSQSLESLTADMRWWFSTSNHRVKIVLLVKLQVSRGTIMLEKWLEVPEPSRRGATTTRGSVQSMRPHCNQTITITRAPSITDSVPNRRNPSSYNVTSGALHILMATATRTPYQDHRHHGCCQYCSIS